jgi:hypothetical protein
VREWKALVWGRRKLTYLETLDGGVFDQYAQLDFKALPPRRVALEFY